MVVRAGSVLRNPHHTTSPLLRYMERTGDTFDNWQIIALKILWYDPMHCEDRIRDEATVEGCGADLVEASAWSEGSKGVSD